MINQGEVVAVSDGRHRQTWQQSASAETIQARHPESHTTTPGSSEYLSCWEENTSPVCCPGSPRLQSRYSCHSHLDTDSQIPVMTLGNVKYNNSWVIWVLVLLRGEYITSVLPQVTMATVTLQLSLSPRHSQSNTSHDTRQCHIQQLLGHLSTCPAERRIHHQCAAPGHHGYSHATVVTLT